MSQPPYPPPYPPPYGQQHPPPQGAPYGSPYGQQPGPYAGPYPGGPPAPARPAHPHPEPRSYDAMLRTHTYAWWRPLLGILLLVVGVLAAQVLLLPVLLVGAAFEGGDGAYVDRVLDAMTMESLTPSLLLYVNLGLAALIPLSWGTIRLLHGMRPRWLASVQPFLRWRLLWACVGLAVPCLFLSVLVAAVLPAGLEETGGPGAELAPWTGQTVALLVVVLLTTPLQAVGEEYGFRAYLLQAFSALSHGIGRRLGLPEAAAQRVAQAIAVVVTSTGFAFAHGSQNFPLFFDRFAFGVIAAVSVILLGGLEAAIGMHVVNNLVAFGLAIAFGQMDQALTISEVSWWRIPVTVVQHSTYLALVLVVARAMHVQRRTAPPQVGAGPAAT
ncbi:CPBP family intramembrane glutamic endopeptidase [Nocardioides aequoreus]|uniref:CPBP family intramembrane glutamic endopeptidase n=1 Tax=Nocardioides aequoreus TaxID=397278 RepID=UPI0006915668|nr:type II CAAX endopeptidase family protein [Nocardioides aequoreus]